MIQVLRILSNFPLKPVGEDDDLKFILSNALILEICKFLEEFSRLETSLREEKKEDILEVLIPFHEPIKQWNPRVLRNQNIAHPHRDRKGKFAPYLQTVLDHITPNKYEEILLIGHCVAYLIDNINCYLIEDYKQMVRQYEPYRKTIQDQIDKRTSIVGSYSELNEKLLEIQNEFIEKKREKNLTYITGNLRFRLPVEPIY